MTRHELREIRQALDDLHEDGECPQMNTIARCLNKISTILAREGY